MQAIRTARHKMGKCWSTPKISMRFKGIVFSGLAINTALSGLEAFVLNMRSPLAVQSLAPSQQL
eukprot:7157491-Pyramimonas_sp.AAC.1